LAQLRESGSALEAKIAGLYSELSEQQEQISILKATLMEKTGRLETVEADLAKRKAGFESQQKRLEEKQTELGRLQAGKEQELTRQKETLSEAKKQIKRVKKENPVADYLLSEAHEPPEMDILAVLIHQKEVPIDEIKRIAKSPPAITTRVLKEMENKGILELTSSDTARLAISLEPLSS
jgi:chromosome segregation ATPase